MKAQSGMAWTRFLGLQDCRPPWDNWILPFGTALLFYLKYIIMSWLFFWLPTQMSTEINPLLFKRDIRPLKKAQDVWSYLHIQIVMFYSFCWSFFRDDNLSVRISELWSCIFLSFPLTSKEPREWSFPVYSEKFSLQLNSDF